MNIDDLVSWGSKTLRYLDRDPESGVDPEVLEQKLGWLTEKSLLHHYRTWPQVTRLLCGEFGIWWSMVK
jgi:hypothetical protein